MVICVRWLHLINHSRVHSLSTHFSGQRTTFERSACGDSWVLSWSASEKFHGVKGELSDTEETRGNNTGVESGSVWIEYWRLSTRDGGYHWITKTKGIWILRKLCMLLISIFWSLCQVVMRNLEPADMEEDKQWAQRRMHTGLLTQLNTTTHGFGVHSIQLKHVVS